MGMSIVQGLVAVGQSSVQTSIAVRGTESQAGQERRVGESEGSSRSLSHAATSTSWQVTV